MTAVPRIVVSAPSAGHGKSAVAIGLLAAFTARGLAAAGCKVGPDHTDAAYLGLAAQRRARNLDPRLLGQRRIAPLFAHAAAGADVAVVEGTMGLYDALAEESDADSTAGVATALRAPVVLVIDVAAMGQSVAAMVHGFRAFDELVWLGGVVLNRVTSERHEELLRDAMDDIGVPVLGVLHRDLVAEAAQAGLPGRHLGVEPVARRAADAARAVRRLGEIIEGSVDVERVLGLARSAPRLAVEAWSPHGARAEEETLDVVARPPVLAVAGGPDLEYGYPETAELLAAAGARIMPVDPLRDEALPPGTAGLIIGDALPEAYAAELSANVRLRRSVAELAGSGAPVVAEGAGLLWLARELDGLPMCGVLDATAHNTDHLVVGYREATAHGPSPVAPAGTRLVGYKHHRAVVAPRAGAQPAWTWAGGPPEGFIERRVYASQLRLHWVAVPGLAQRVVVAARQAARQAASPESARHAVESVPTTIIPIARRATGRAPVGGHPTEVA
ncbi:cobyrinate a,c-diamide synthase [Rhizomonospora bruguierae]|uniref:cobyrinate a,c-diamide synthase n=1 Tax=Rhizomonospora bruguierae TaxID=1581705 RepID=UPI001BCC469B|nr:cobyrinate a,c-diamide synthase [Micromonospora sp. NBRC 107566]